MTAELYGALCAVVAAAIAFPLGYRFGRRERQAEAEWRDYDESLPPSGVVIHSKKESHPAPFDWKTDL